MFATMENVWDFCRPHPKDGEGNVFTLSTPGGVRSVQPGGGQVSPAGGGLRSVQLRGGGRVRSVQPGGWVGQSSRGGGGSVSRRGVSILHPLAGGMPLAFTQEDFLVFLVLGSKLNFTGFLHVPLFLTHSEFEMKFFICNLVTLYCQFN